MMRKSKFLKLVLVLSLFITLVVPASAFAASEQTVDEVRQLLSAYHISGITEEELIGKDIDEMIEALDDPYTEYFTADEMRMFVDSIENHFVGIGVQVSEDERGTYIVQVFPGTPAEQAGFQRDDYITAVNGKSVEGLSVSEVVDQILGPERSSVTITVLRDNKKLDIKVTRNQVQIPLVKTRLFGKIGYIELTSFSQDGDKLFAKALDELLAGGMEALVLDLRYNTGGYMNTMIGIGRKFISEGTLYHMKNRDGEGPGAVIKNGTLFDKPIFILQNEWSASASEALAGALRDLAGARLIGTKSYGKGSMQILMPLADESTLKVTTVEYLTPHKTKVNQVGLEPDVLVYGDMAQLLTALRAAGLDSIELSLGQHRASINHVEIEEMFWYLQENGQIFVPARVLAALIGANVTWNSKTFSVELSSADSVQVFKIAPDVARLYEGISFINLDAFAKAFPGFQWSTADDHLTLQIATDKKEK